MIRFTSLSVLALSFFTTAQAQDFTFGAEVVASTAVHDRGEQIGPETFEAGLVAEIDTGSGVVYGGLYRLTPIGGDQSLFDDEVDYTLGYAYEGEGHFIDLSANWLTYPGSASEASLELVGIFGIEAPFSPEVMAFYDADFKDFGMELALTHEVPLTEQWLGGATLLGGFVEPGDGSANRSYAGLILNAIRPLSETVEFSAYTRFDIADEDSFIEDSGASAKSSGIAAGIAFAITFGE